MPVDAMRTITVEARNLDSAYGFFDALSAFETELLEEDGVYRIRVTFGDGKREILAALNAIEEHVTLRGDGLASVKMDGKRYVIQGRNGK